MAWRGEGLWGPWAGTAAEAFSVVSQGPAEWPSLLLWDQTGFRGKGTHKGNGNEIYSDGCKLEYPGRGPFPGVSLSFCAQAPPHGAPTLPPATHKWSHSHVRDRCRPARLRPKGLETLAPFSLGPLMSLGNVFLEAVMKAFQEMRGRVKYIAAATCLWLVCFYF